MRYHAFPISHRKRPLCANKATSRRPPRSYQLKDQKLHPLSTTLFMSARSRTTSSAARLPSLAIPSSASWTPSRSGGSAHSQVDPASALMTTAVIASTISWACALKLRANSAEVCNGTWPFALLTPLSDRNKSRSVCMINLLECRGAECTETPCNPPAQRNCSLAWKRSSDGPRFPDRHLGHAATERRGIAGRLPPDRECVQLLRGSSAGS